jgi:hypothetical protein
LARPGTSAAALGPGLGGYSFLGACLPLAGAAGNVGRASVVVSELGRPLDDESAGRPGWVGVSLSPYLRKNRPDLRKAPTPGPGARRGVSRPDARW